jgi:hypothetical protein
MNHELWPRRLPRFASSEHMKKATPISEQLQLSPEGERHSAEQKQERDSMIPFDAFTEIRPREYGEDAKRYNLLDDFQLKCCEFGATLPFIHCQAIRRF